MGTSDPAHRNLREKASCTTVQLCQGGVRVGPVADCVAGKLQDEMTRLEPDGMTADSWSPSREVRPARGSSGSAPGAMPRLNSYVSRNTVADPNPGQR